ncbi:MAG: hypothetical protein IJK60_02415 [Clostridia bacterium]|nr:hypothetical protein [Clostridia bacterium]
MASGQILRRAFFGGFKREDVIDYVEKLQIKLSDSQKTAESLRLKADNVDKNESVICSLNNEIEKLRIENDTNQNTIQSLNERIISEQAVFDNIRNICDEFEKNRSDFENLINSTNLKKTDKLTDALKSLIVYLDSVSSNFDTDYFDNDQFRFDVDGLTKVEEEFLSKKFSEE